MAERFRDEERGRSYRSGYDEDRDFERGARMRFVEDRGGGYGETPRYEYGRYGGRGPRSDYEFGGGGFQRFGDPYGFESDYSRTPEATYPREFGREQFDQAGEYAGGEFERGARRSAFGWGERRRRESMRGRGPKDYARSDERIREDICDELTEDPILDASEIEVKVANGEVTLSGTVEGRTEKRRAEDDADSIPGVKFVQNNLRIAEPTATRGREIGTTSGTAGGNLTGTVAGSTRTTAAKEPQRA